MDKLLIYYNEIMNTTFGRLTWAILVAMAVYFVLDFIFGRISKRISKMLPSELSNNPSKPILIFMKVGKFLVFIVILLLTLDSLGVKVVSLLAGLGIGGLAIAFAAQKVLGDLFIYVLIKLDKPFEEGDLINFGTITGKVKKIGIKTTRIDSDSETGEEIIVSNSGLLEGKVINFAKRKQRRITFDISVSNQTAKENLQAIIALVKGIIENQNDAVFKRGHLKGFSAGAVEYEFVFDVTKLDSYMAVQEKVYLAILDAFAERNIIMSYPAQKVLLEKN